MPATISHLSPEGHGLPQTVPARNPPLLSESISRKPAKPKPLIPLDIPSAIWKKALLQYNTRARETHLLLHINSVTPSPRSIHSWGPKVGEYLALSAEEAKECAWIDMEEESTEGAASVGGFEEEELQDRASNESESKDREASNDTSDDGSLPEICLHLRTSELADIGLRIRMGKVSAPPHSKDEEFDVFNLWQWEKYTGETEYERRGDEMKTIHLRERVPYRRYRRDQWRPRGRVFAEDFRESRANERPWVPRDEMTEIRGRLVQCGRATRKSPGREYWDEDVEYAFIGAWPEWVDAKTWEAERPTRRIERKRWTEEARKVKNARDAGETFIFDKSREELKVWIDLMEKARAGILAGLGRWREGQEERRGEEVQGER